MISEIKGYAWPSPAQRPWQRLDQDLMGAASEYGKAHRMAIWHAVHLLSYNWLLPAPPAELAEHPLHVRVLNGTHGARCCGPAWSLPLGPSRMRRLARTITYTVRASCSECGVCEWNV